MTTNLAGLSEDDFRTAVRDVVRTKAPGRPPKGGAGRLAWRKEWQAVLFDNGMAGPGWPRRYGGMELPFGLQVAYQDELAKARVPAPVGNGPSMAGPTIIQYGTDEQRERFLRPMLRCDEVWAQGFSEPDAGSDLPGLRTTAVRDGDLYVVNGQKVWNTFADVSDWAFVLVRTGTPASRAAGISYLLVDMKTPGITVRPLRDLTGHHDFCEIFFDNVAVPVSQRVGEENGGWKIARTTLGHERAAGALNQAAFYRRVTDELLALARERGLTASPVVRRRLADLDGKVRIMHVSSMRIISDIVAHGEPGPASSVSRLYNATLEQELHEVAVDLLGGAAVVLGDDPDTVDRGRWTYGFLRTRASTIGAGTAEIQRNTIAEQVLQLPHDPAMPPRPGS